MKNKSLLFIVSLIALILVNISEVRAQRWDDWRFSWKGLIGSEDYNDTERIYVGVIFPTFSTSKYRFDRDQSWNSPSIHPSSSTKFSNISATSGIEVGALLNVRLRISNYWSIFSGVNSPNLIHFSSFEHESVLRKGLGLRFSYPHDSIAYKMQSNVLRGSDLIGERNFIRMEIPLQIHLRSDLKTFSHNYSSRWPTYRLYLLGGGKYGWHLSANDFYNDDDNIPPFDPSLIVKPNYISIEFGLGLDLYFPFCKVSPEIKFSEGLGNMLDHSRHKELATTRPDYGNPFMDSLNRLSLRGIQFSIILE